MRTASCAIVVLILTSLLAGHLIYGQGVRQGVEDLGNKLVQNVPKDRQIVVVVSDFPNLQGDICELGRYISARLTTKLSQTAGVSVRERSRLEQVLSELAFNIEGLVDPQKAKQVGKLLGADALVLGEISDLGTTVEIDARFVMLETGNSLPGAFTAISKDSVVEELLHKGCTAAVVGGPLPGEVAGSRTPEKKPTSSMPNFQNGFLRMTATHLAWGTIDTGLRKVDGLTLATTVLNLTDENIRIGLGYHTGGVNFKTTAKLTATRGTACFAWINTVSGISLLDVREFDKRKELTEISPRSEINIAFKMECDGKATTEKFAFTAQFFGGARGKEEAFQIGIPNITAKLEE